ncbi:regulator of microtubule dynamics protein 2 [Nematostella vectensis]|uniref:regulator of microtubule dynamics protein 2 n=1 Tax=Nematostella vectensis TaxID=45351 RepID=UPI00207715D2|nr:regulator of microtubule dynamics protein 2 [Nematostella vectensis]
MATVNLVSPELNFSSFGRHIVIGTTLGLSIAMGITAGMYITKKMLQSRSDEDGRIVVCMLELTQEMRELRSVIIRLESSLEAQAAKPINIVKSSGSLKDSKSVRTSSDDEDEFYEAPQDEEILTMFSKAEQLESQTSQKVESSSQDAIKSIIKEVEELHQDKSRTDKQTERIQIMLKDATDKYPCEAELWWRLARAYSDLSPIKAKQEGEEKKKDLLYKGLAAAQKAVELNDKLSNAHKWCSIMLGSTTEYESTQDQILQGFKYKEHIVKAIELNHKDPTCYHLLGRWCYEVSQLSWWKRKAAAAIAAEPPTSTVEEALDNFLKAEALQPGFWLSNTYWIAMCYYQQSAYSKSKEWVTKALAMDISTSEDRESHQKATELLASL